MYSSLRYIAFLVVVISQHLQYTHGAGVGSAPYFDVTLDTPHLPDYVEITGQKHYTLAFALGGLTGGCEPSWGAQFPIDEPEIIGPIKEVIAAGGEMIIATGGAVGPYLEHTCTSAPDLANAYKMALDAVGTHHLDIDVEAPIDNDMVTTALAMVQSERPSVTVSFTLMVQGEDYGIVPDLGVKVLESAKANGVRVDVVNIMAMEFPKQSEDFGDAVINAAISTLGQMAAIWPEKSEAELKAMLGVTPMIGRNFNGNIFMTSHGHQLVDWSNAQGIAHLSFWSIGRDNGDCPGGTLSPICSGIDQGPQEFTLIFQEFTPTNPAPTTTVDPTAPTTTTTERTTTPPSRDCTEEGIGGIECETSFWNCVLQDGELVKYVLNCAEGLVYDPDIKGCNYPDVVGCA